ncbi:MAG TPA: site-specific DNA-methyltransferase [Chloroflexia bacterium]|jgi:DNA modification methylase|nr:site-specific DNA-methyltransferase [Chloroflexia bacterium]
MNAAQLSFFPAPDIAEEFMDDSRMVIHLGDSCEFLRTLPSGVVNLVITSPPYNIGKAYESKTNIEAYLKSQETLIDELVRVLADTGSICWQVGNYVENGEIFPLDMYYYPIFKKRGLKLRNRIVWHFGHGLHASKRFSGRYETILWFTKSDSYTFNLDDVRVPSKYPGKRHFKGEKRGQPSGNPLGKNPSDIWEFIASEWEAALWDIPNVKSNHPEKTIHPCQFPVELVERCVLALTREDDWVLDPYCGVGSSLIAGVKHNRRVLGVDKEAQYVEIAKDRVTAWHEGRLKVRQLGTEVYEPTGRESVSRVPKEWSTDEGTNGSAG